MNLATLIQSLLQQEGKPLSSKELAEHLAVHLNAVNETLESMKQEDQVVQTASGRWERVMGVPKSMVSDRTKGSRGRRRRSKFDDY
jgi:predicted ArsR family transcriptional regulator